MSIDKETSLLKELMLVQIEKKNEKLKRLTDGIRYAKFVMSECPGIKDCDTCEFFNTEFEMLGCLYKADLNILTLLNYFEEILNDSK